MDNYEFDIFSHLYALQDKLTYIYIYIKYSIITEHYIIYPVQTYRLITIFFISQIVHVKCTVKMNIHVYHFNGAVTKMHLAVP